ncbi:MAG TPA: hypothetical protein VF365_09630 [Candidatus Limnocylindria bacterium]
MPRVARRVGIAFGSFALTWVAASFAAGWLIGSGNILVWVFATFVSVIAHLAILRRDQRVGYHGVR